MGYLTTVLVFRIPDINALEITLFLQTLNLISSPILKCSIYSCAQSST